MVLDGLVTWTREMAVSFGAVGLFALAFVESMFFPIPPDVALIPLALTTPELALFYAFVATLGSVAGAIAGYEVGRTGGRPVLERMVSERNIDRVEHYYDAYGVLAVGVAGFTPIPYKVFTLSSGAFKLNRAAFILVSILSRGGRFFLEAVLILLYGEEIVSFITGAFGLLTLLAAGALVTAYIVWKQYF